MHNNACEPSARRPSSQATNTLSPSRVMLSPRAPSRRDRLSETHKAVNELRALRRRAEDWLARARDKPELEAVANAAQSVIDRLKPIEAELINVEAKSRGDTLNFPVKLNGKLAALAGNISSADAAPRQRHRRLQRPLSPRPGPARSAERNDRHRGRQPERGDPQGRPPRRRRVTVLRKIREKFEEKLVPSLARLQRICKER